MRSLPEPARLAIATMYLRLRDARRHRANLLHRHGADFPAYLVADGQWLEAHNALQSVVGRIHEGRVSYRSPGEMLKLVAMRGRQLARMAAEGLPDLTEERAREILKEREPGYEPRWNVEVEGRTITWCEGDHHRSEACDTNTITV